MLFKRSPQKEVGVLGSFGHLDTMIEAVKEAKEAGVEVRDVFSPVPVEEIPQLLSPGRSPVRFITFTGGISGMIGGFALGILTSVVWDMIVGGKPVTHHVPFVVVGFELTILLGALSTLLALLHFTRLPYRKFPGKAYRPEFSNDKFGVWLASDGKEVERARSILEGAGAESVIDIGERPAYEMQEVKA